jgi:hypothetical protein
MRNIFDRSVVGAFAPSSCERAPAVRIVGGRGECVLQVKPEARRGGGGDR